ncbi:hypothetical protein HHI36_011390 [Cryptolaemus montrouzieri]|uniref:Uncharacterized protein n=1 Tax=Cryptolaemus montrouzieri TaxID=559131 RepID=A0ABD2MLL9_9CUCU
MSFYKIQRPTTNSGLSTWILLSGDSASTTSTTPKAVNVSDTEDLKVIEISGSKIVKPMFKKRTTTRKPTTQVTTQKLRTTVASTKRPKPSTNLVKIKASALSNTQKKNNTKTIGSSIKEVTEHPMDKTKLTTFSRIPLIKTTTLPTEKLQTSSQHEKTMPAVTVTNSVGTNVSSDSQNLPMEAKEGEVNITESTTNTTKKKKNKTKKNKNKNRRKKIQSKTSNSTTTKPTKTKNTSIEKPLGTQLYNYLSREMMPTIGVGLVGLMVTAGLASYFLYPFGAARRIYEVDRKDKEGSYYYNNPYSGGTPEEEVLGKVIAGMPLNKLQNNIFKPPTTKKSVSNTVHPQNMNHHYQNHLNHATHQNPQNHHSIKNPHNYQNQQNYQTVQSNKNDQIGLIQGTVESVPLGSTKDSYLANSYEKDSYQPITYKNNEVDSEISVDKKFVVGTVPKGIVEEITPAAVPEHGPRMLRIRRNIKPVNYADNDVLSDAIITDNPSYLTTKDEFILSSTEKEIEFSTTGVVDQTTSTNSTNDLENNVQSVISLIKDIFHLKINMGLELVKNATRSISSYIEKVQKRLDSHYRKSQKSQ